MSFVPLPSSASSSSVSITSSTQPANANANANASTQSSVTVGVYIGSLIFCILLIIGSIFLAKRIEAGKPRENQRETIYNQGQESSGNTMQQNVNPNPLQVFEHPDYNVRHSFIHVTP
jgi:hypothetical protein